MREFIIFWRHSLRMMRYVRGVFAALALLLLASASLLSHVEELHFGEALYFTLITGLTVGYGDITPESLIGRVLSIFAGIVGVVFVGLIVAIATRALALTAQEASPQYGRDSSQKD